MFMVWFSDLKDYGRSSLLLEEKNVPTVPNCGKVK